MMTLPSTYASKIGQRLPSQSERQAANSLRQVLAACSGADGESSLRIAEPTGKSTDVVITPALSDLLIELLRHIGKGDAVTLVPVTQMLTTQQAADILNVSRPFLIGLLESGDIRYHKVGRHRRVKAEDLFDFKQARDAERSEAMDDLVQDDAEFL